LTRSNYSLILTLALAGCLFFFPFTYEATAPSSWAQVPDFPRYAITTFAVSADLVDQEADLLQKAGAYNVTIVYREADPARIGMIHEKLKRYGESMIPELSYKQTLDPIDRIRDADVWFESHKAVTGETPKGFFSFQVDTYLANHLRDQYEVLFAVGNVWDQVNMDFMSMRGGPALPYYASRHHSLVPARNRPDSSVLIIQPFAIAPTGKYHFDNNHLIDLYTLGIGIDEFKYVSLNYPFFAPFFLELDWVLNLNSAVAIESFIESYRWVYRTFNVITADEFARIFRSSFPETPEYHFIYKSSNHESFPESSGLTVEWLMSQRFRIARINGVVVSALDYDRQERDPHLSTRKTIDIAGPRFGEDPSNIIDTSLMFDVDDLWQHEHGDRTLRKTGNVTYSGDLHFFYSDASARPTQARVPWSPRHARLSLIFRSCGSGLSEVRLRLHGTLQL
jgi:hypothetical protein